MLYFTRLTTAIVIAIVASLAEEWTKPYPLKLGGVAAALIGFAVIVVLWITRTKPIKGARGRESVLREILLGGVAATVWFGLMHVYFQVAERTPGIPGTILDCSREETEKNATLHENAGNFSAAADLLLESLESPHSRECEVSFAERTIRDLTRASQAANRKTREQLLKRAIEVAARFKVPDDLPQQALQRLLEGDALGGLQEKFSSSETRAKKAEEGRIRLERERQILDANQAAREQTHKAEAAELKRRSNLIQQALARLTDSAVSSAASLSGNVIDGDLKNARLTLLRVIRETGKSDRAAKDALGKLEAAILAVQPVDLPGGAAARIRRVDSPVMPGMMLIDIEVLDASGKPLGGLVSKDFSAGQSGRKLRILASPFSRTESLAVFVLIDTSDSTAGAPISATKTAVPEFITRLPANASIRVSSFSDRLNVLADFTQEKNRAIAASQVIRAGGGTALNQSAHEEIRGLSTKPGSRVLVVFTDGANSLPGPREEDIINAARVAKVAVYFVALKGAGYSDTSVIERIASDTGGKTFHVQEASKLAEAFRAISDSLQQTGYRLALLDYAPNIPCQVTIGGEGAVRLTVEDTPSTSTLTQRPKR
ncbi:MAG: VWA domain-containing protein [Pirellulales bacterium]